MIKVGMKEGKMIKVGMKVRTTTTGGTRGIIVPQKNLKSRVNGVGFVRGPVPGHGGDVLWVEDIETGEVGAYMFDELLPL